MRIVIDGLIFQKDPHGGIARLYCELLPRVCDLDPRLEMDLVTDGPLRGSLPEHAQIRPRPLPAVRRTLRPQGAMRRVLYPLRRAASRAWNAVRHRYLGDGGGAIWHSTFYTHPVRWAGAQVVTVYDMIPERFPEFFSDPLDEAGRRQKRRCIEMADAVICISQATRDALASIYDPPAEKMMVIYPAPGKMFFPGEPEATLPGGLAGGPYLLYVGSRFHYKNFERLLEAYRGWERRNRVRLVCAGAAWRADEARKIRQYGLEDRVTLIQQAGDDVLCWLYRQALALVVPSFDEGFGFPVVEALASGCPVVVSDIAVMREVAGEAAITFGPSDTAACRAALEQAFQENRSPERIRCGLEWVKRYSWERAAAATLDVYRSLAGDEERQE